VPQAPFSPLARQKIIGGNRTTAVVLGAAGRTGSAAAEPAKGINNVANRMAARNSMEGLVK
jgi:hypothetical protein